ncbi:hypothetical protein PM082_021940 [Marasmius tenuissimus]|nr:hypothetical protein PM082_021940 [Marasmius tenuissimus]
MSPPWNLRRARFICRLWARLVTSGGLGPLVKPYVSSVTSKPSNTVPSKEATFLFPKGRLNSPTTVLTAGLSNTPKTEKLLSTKQTNLTNTSTSPNPNSLTRLAHIFDGKCIVLINLDEGKRGGKSIATKASVDVALNSQECKGIEEKAAVLKRMGNQVDFVEGGDLC